MKLLAIAALSVILSACGGGGGGSTSKASTPAPQTYYASTIDNTPAPTPTYAPGSEELAAFNLINAERTACGFGSLKQAAALDTSSANHVTWMGSNNFAVTHYEQAKFTNTNVATANFTGINPIDRVSFTGYPQTAAERVSDEGFTLIGTTNKVGLGTNGVRALLGGPYHMIGMLAEFRDIGFSVLSMGTNGADITAPSGSGERTMIWSDLSWKSSDQPQLMASDAIATYPCQGTTGTIYQLSNESPNPVPGRNLATNPLGQPIYVAGRIGNVVSITNASMIQVSNGSVVTLRAPIGFTNDPVQPCTRGCFQTHMSYVIPDTPLLPNTQYQVNLAGKNNGADYSRSFTFTTGAVGI